MDPQSYQIPDVVEKLLSPISADSPTGKAVMNELMQLNHLIKQNEVEKGIALAEKALREMSKDIHIAVRLCFLWFLGDATKENKRNIEGLKNGLILVIELLKKYKRQVFPEKPEHKTKAINYLNNQIFEVLLGQATIDASNAKHMLGAGQAINTLVAVCKEELEGPPPVLEKIVLAFQSQVKKAQKYITPDKAARSDESDAEASHDSSQETTATSSDTNGSRENSARSQDDKEDTADSKHRSPSTIRFDNIIPEVRKTLRSLFREARDDAQKIPTDTRIYILSRALQWGNVTNSSSDYFEPPSKEQVKYFEDQYKVKNWFELIPAIEYEFLNADSGFCYWLDAQKYVIKALENVGNLYSKIAESLKYTLGNLLVQAPWLMNDAFGGTGNLSFASAETREWIETEINSRISGNGKSDLALMPIVDENYDMIIKEHNAIKGNINKDFVKTLMTIQAGIAGEIRPKGRFLRRLNIATLCIHAHEYELAKVHLIHLQKEIEAYHLDEWEPDLCLSVWQSSYLANLEILKREKTPSKVEEVHSQQEKLIEKIVILDSAKAFQLTKHLSKDGGN